MIVFAGPSVDAATRESHPQIDWRPPAIAGDLMKLVAAAPSKVLLIDGLFDERASVRHKEALALMSAGTTLMGATSMGALRAAELAPFGMIPLGPIASAYCEGRLVGDDEVALVHGDDRIGWKAISVAMVEVRATLCKAVRMQLIDVAAARRLRARWHDIHFVDRDWPRMIETAGDLVDRSVAEAIAQAYVPLKQRDAACSISAALANAGPARDATPIPQTWFDDRLAERLISP